MSKKAQEVQKPIFIHSLFRAGSTYIFKVFRRSGSGYYCYQEPLNEFLIYTTTEPDKLLGIAQEMQEYLRHPELDKPYFYEFHKIADEIATAFHKEFSYDQYFISENDDIGDLKAYFTILMDGAEGQPVFQCCRSVGRVERLKSDCDGLHVFLWRNPWDQWWSFKKGFDTNNLLIYNAKSLPVFLDTLKKELNLPDFHNADAFVEYDFFNKHWLSANESYKIFYALWCYAMLEAESHCDLSISIDKLSASNVYRQEILAKLGESGVEGLDFSDCTIPIATYGESDGKFFLKIESYIHGLLLSHGYSHAQVGRLITLSEERNALVVDTHVPDNSTVRDGMRAREYLQQAENKLAQNWRVIREMDKQVKYLEPAKAQLETDLNQLKGEAATLQEQYHHWNVTANQLDEELKAVYASKSWRIMLNLRKIMHLMIRFALQLRKVMQWMSRLPKQAIQLIRTSFISVMRYVITQPLLKKITLTLLLRFPRVKTYFNTMALRAGLSTKQAYKGNVGQPTTGYRLRATQKRKGVLPIREGEEGMLQVTPRARRIYAELNACRVQNEQENL